MWTNTGTIFYKAPEMFQGNYGIEVDIWAVGVMCYEMITGQLPFGAVLEKQTIKQIKETQPSYKLKNITDSCVNFIKKCL